MSSIAPSQTVSTAKYKTSKKQLTIGFDNVDLTNSWSVQSEKSAQLVAAQYGAKLVVTNANGSSSKQISDIQDLIAQGVDGLVISPVNSNSLAGVLRQAAAKGIPVVAQGAEVDSPDLLSQIYVTNQSFGKYDGEQMCAMLHNHGNVVMLSGPAGVQASVERDQAGRAAMTKCGLKILADANGQWTYAGGKSAAQTLIARFPNIDGIWSSGAEMTRAAVDVLKAENKPLVPVTGECSNQFLQLWQKDKLTAAAPMFPTWQGPEAVKLVIRALRGETVKKTYNLQLPGITNATLPEYVNENLSPNWWSDGFIGKNGQMNQYLTDAQIHAMFPTS